MTITSNDPRPVLRQELARVFKNQRVIRAFEKIFDLIPPEFIDQQAQIDAINLIAESAGSSANEALAAIDRLTAAIEALAVATTPPPPSPARDDLSIEPVPAYEYFLIGDGLIGLPPNSRPAIDQSITPVWTGAHQFNAIVGAGRAGIANVALSAQALSATNLAIYAIEQAGVHAILLRPNVGNTGTVNLLTSDFLSGAAYLPLHLSGRGANGDFILNTNGVAQFGLPFLTKGYTVATLPAGTLGMIAHVTDANAPAFNTAVVGGGAVKIPVFYNGAAWVAI